MAIDRTKAKERYVSGASANAEKLVENYVAQPGKLDAAKSDQAEKNFAEGVSKAVSTKSRQKALGRLTEQDLNTAMLAKGASSYRTGTSAAKDTWAEEVEPHLATLDNLKLPARTTDPMQNIDNRVKGVAKALIETKKRVKGV